MGFKKGKLGGLNTICIKNMKISQIQILWLVDLTIALKARHLIWNIHIKNCILGTIEDVVTVYANPRR